MNDPRTNGGKYIDFKKIQPRTFQAGEKAYNSKWFIEKENTNQNNNSQNGTTTKVKFAVLEFGSAASFETVKKFPKATQSYAEEMGTIKLFSSYDRTIGSLSSFKVEVALDEFYQKGKDDLSKGINSFLAGYSSYIDKLTKSTVEKDVATVTNKANSGENSKTYLYGQKTKYVNSLVSEINDVQTEVGYKIRESLNKIDNKFRFTGWKEIFEILKGNDGLGNFYFPLREDGELPPNDWRVSLAKFYDSFLTALFSAKDSTTSTSIITNLISLQVEQAKPKAEVVKYFRVLRTIAKVKDPNPGGSSRQTNTSVAYMVRSVAADFIESGPEFNVFLDEEFSKEVPQVITATVGGVNYNYDKKDPYQVSDWLSGFSPGTIKDSWLG